MTDPLEKHRRTIAGYRRRLAAMIENLKATYFAMARREHQDLGQALRRVGQPDDSTIWFERSNKLLKDIVVQLRF